VRVKVVRLDNRQAVPAGVRAFIGFDVDARRRLGKWGLSICLQGFCFLCCDCHSPIGPTGKGKELRFQHWEAGCVHVRARCSSSQATASGRAKIGWR